MKNLFSIKNFATAVLALGFVFSFTSCEEDLCKDVTCATGGTLTDNGTTCTCVCGDGYEGTDCATLSRTKFLSASGAETTWDAIDICPLGGGVIDTFAFDAKIQPSGSSEISVLVNNFGGFGTQYTFTVPVDGDRFDLSTFDFGGVTVTNISGRINAAGTVITVTYSSTDANGTISCSGTWNLR